MKWIIFYGDGTTFSGEPEAAPQENVQCIAIEDENYGVGAHGRFVMDSWDFYIYSDHAKGWHGTNRTSDLIDHLKQGCGPGGVRAVLTGRWIANDTYKEILQRAKTEGDFHSQSATPRYPESGKEVD